MKKRGLLSLTMLTISCTALLMTSAGWFSGKNSPNLTTNHPDAHPHVKAQVPFLTEAAWRYRRSQPAHWRALILQR